MSDEEPAEDEVAPKKSKKGLLIGLVVALLGGGGAFYAVFSGMVLAPETELADEQPEIEKTDVATFVPIDPLVISLGRTSQRQLRFQAQIEVHTDAQSAVENVMPRIVDVLNGYLRAVDLEDLENPSALVVLRGQMLRRIELVTGKGHVKDLLITEFVLT